MIEKGKFKGQKVIWTIYTIDHCLLREEKRYKELGVGEYL